MNALLTPYVVVDLKALVMHLAIVKHFVSMEKFIVLIPAEGKLKRGASCE